MEWEDLYSKTIFCPLEKCQRWLKQTRGSRANTVSDKFPPYRFHGIAKCEICGGIYDGEKWIHRCIVCEQNVQPGTLVGLFVPHACVPCKQKQREDQIQKKQVCLLCHKPYVDCCC